MKKLVLATPRGFCAGVDRAIHVVEKAIEKFGTPIYVRHEIVHNKFVVETLKSKGVVFVDELDQVPEGSVVIFSAHGVAERIYEDAKARTCRCLMQAARWCSRCISVPSAITMRDAISS